MKQSLLIFTCCLLVAGTLLLPQREEKNIQKAGFDASILPDKAAKKDVDLQKQIELGEHLVTIAGCHDCHSPKKMTAKGMEIDYANALSGHPSKMPPPDVNRTDVEKKGLVVTQTLTAWVGPWGISYAANLTPDKTGIGNWQESNFITAIRQGKYKGIPNGRPLLPPMPWDMYRNMTDEELKAVFAYLKSIKPVQNVVPAPVPPLSAAAPAKK
ncbi:c-type cytochrome [Pontibacter sp. H259]|uniref:c-type cytochrome n=1 Tax=Pontibacter sp. H259 TaxID=3133421 RepID=UPI0030C49783